MYKINIIKPPELDFKTLFRLSICCSRATENGNILRLKTFLKHWLKTLRLKTFNMRLKTFSLKHSEALITQYLQLKSLRFSATSLLEPYICDPSINDVMVLSCSRGATFSLSVWQAAADLVNIVHSEPSGYMIGKQGGS